MSRRQHGFGSVAHSNQVVDGALAAQGAFGRSGGKGRLRGAVSEELGRGKAQDKLVPVAPARDKGRS